MVAIVAHDAIRQPAHPDNRPWLVVWVGANSGDAIFADSLSDIVGKLIEGYDDLDDEDDNDLHLQARIDALAPMAAQAQAIVLADLSERGIRLTETELNAALRNKEDAAGITRWNPAEPLVLLTTAYEPFADAPRPEGSILWLDPTNEAAFLSALNKLGAGELWVTGG